MRIFKEILNSFTDTARFSKIVFERSGDPGWLPRGIFTINPDGSNCVQIRSTGLAPEWSPDGKWIAFYDAPHYTSYSNIYIMRPNGKDVNQITHHTDGSAACPTWSPDSKRIVYCVWKDQVHQVWTVDIESLHQKQITHEGSNGYPVWTPSNEIVFWKEDFSPHKIFIMDPDGKNQREYDIFREGDQEPTWSRDGSKITFVRDGKIYVMNSDGTNLQTVPGAINVIEVSWSPDGKKIAYSRSEWTSGQEIYVVDLNGENHIKIVENPFGPNEKEVGSCDVCWSPWL